ncbi:hypothetical protein R1sor_015673 [Riccia sorocarpa]|uniref:Plastid lipid-associated protein/fibrillin conserved domain-containing protein n=1 Tax=Riccia sorocarpa TaxID=122646 RepID=A0ABD3HGU8_9MARC
MASCCGTSSAVLAVPNASAISGRNGKQVSGAVSMKSKSATSPSLQLFGAARKNLKEVKRNSFVVAASDGVLEGPSEEQNAEQVAITTPATTTLVKAPEEENSGEDNSVEDLKQSLVDSLYGTDRGLRASSETRGEIVELITQLEAQNPTAAPTEALALLDGKWILAYTSFSELFPLLAAANLPLVKVGEISQTFDASSFTVQNSVLFSGPLATTSFSTSASFLVRSPKRVQVKFEEGIIGTPQLTDSLDIPDNVEFLGQKVDLVAFQSVLRPLQDAASSLARTISGQPPFKFPFQSERTQSWLLTTYLDEDLRISRGDGGSIFVLLKEGSPLLEL